MRQHARAHDRRDDRSTGTEGISKSSSDTQEQRAGVADGFLFSGLCM